jgi:hypothetical protein
MRDRITIYSREADSLYNFVLPHMIFFDPDQKINVFPAQFLTREHAPSMRVYQWSVHSSGQDGA